MKFNIIIDIPDDMISNYQQWTQKHEKNLHINLFNINEVEDLIRDIVEEQTTFSVEKCVLIDKKDLIKLKESFKI